MKIIPVETFEQSYKDNKPRPATKFQKSVEEIILTKLNQTNYLYVLPKVISLDLENDECHIDYPFEEVSIHYGLFKFMWEVAKVNSHRVNCNTDCPICKWMSENRTPTELFKIAVANGFNLAYVIHDKRIKLGWFPNDIHAIYHNSLGVLMNEKKINLIEALRYRVKVYTGENKKLSLEIDPDPAKQLPIDHPSVKACFEKIYNKPLVEIIDNEILTPIEELNTLLGYIQIKLKELQQQEKATIAENSIEGFGDLESPKIIQKTTNNEVITDDSGPF